ncbi:MAG: DUF2971 domain-containing protein [Lachnospiraceae bacterium]|nr:DUF2971 domain-containing protein [Lachnospiraceae bacterium]
MILYHYTDFNALDGIIRGGELRLNNILNMNDRSEMRLFVNELSSSVIHKLKSDNCDQAASIATNFFKTELAEEFHYSAYAACFSEYRDDAAQWERYAKGGQGVCIAFHKEKLEELIKSANSVSLKKVLYRDTVADHSLINKFIDLFKTPNCLERRFDDIQDMMNEAWIQSAAFKHPSFASENEVRLIYTPFSAEEAAVKPKYHIAWDRIKKYYPLDLKALRTECNMHSSELIDEIIIGPASPQSLPILKDYLSDNEFRGLASKVKLSNCPLRKPTT